MSDKKDCQNFKAFFAYTSIDKDALSEDMAKHMRVMLKNELIYSVIGLFIGLISIISGVFLFIHGITGDTSWTTQILKAKSELMDAAPGTILFVAGVFIIWITRYRFQVGSLRRFWKRK